MKCSDTAAVRFSSLRLNPLASRVNRRMRMVKFCRSPWDVLTCAGSGEPVTLFSGMRMQGAGR